MSCNPLNVKSNTIAILGFTSKTEMAHGLTKLPFGTSSPLEMAHGLNKLGFNRIFKDPVLSAICEQ